MQIQAPTVLQSGGGGVDGPPLEFLICCIISKRFYLQWKTFNLLYKMMRYILWQVVLLGGLWWHQQWLPSWPPSWNLPRISNHVKTARNGDFLCLTSKITHKQALCMILATRFTFIVEKTCTFTQKWLHHLLLIMSCLITIETDHYWTWLKMRVRDERTATEKIRCWCFIR